MKAIKSKIIEELEKLEKHIAENPSEELHIKQLDEIYHLSKALHYVDKACEIMQKHENMHGNEHKKPSEY